MRDRAKLEQLVSEWTEGRVGLGSGVKTVDYASPTFVSSPFVVGFAFGSWALSVSGVAPAWSASPRTIDRSRKPTWIRCWRESDGQGAATCFGEKTFGGTAWDPGAVVFGVGERVWGALFIEGVAATLVLSELVFPRFVLVRLAGTWTSDLPRWT